MDNGFSEYKKLIEDKFKLVDTIDKKLDNALIEIAKLKVKSGIWGLIAGAIISIPTAIGLVIFVLSKL